jgi:hypothetical protein
MKTNKQKKPMKTTTKTILMKKINKYFEDKSSPIERPERDLAMLGTHWRHDMTTH